MSIEAVLLIKYIILYCVCENFLGYFITVPEPKLITIPVPASVPAKPNYGSGSGSGKKLWFLRFRFRFRNTGPAKLYVRQIGPIDSHEGRLAFAIGQDR